MNGTLAGKRALVTGAGNGIGRGIAEALAAAGAAVAVTDVDAAAAGTVAAGIVATGGNALAATLDVTDEAAIALAVPRLAAQLGGLSILVNNAGGTLGSYPLVLDATRDYWDHIMDLNLRSIWLMCRVALPLLGPGASIINIASVGAIVHGKGFGVYSTAKAAVVRLTQAIAIDYADRGIRANAICPGTIETDAIARMLALRDDPGAARRAQAAGIPAGRLGMPADVAAVAVFLASDGASFVTGTAQIVDGGAHLS